MSFSLLFAETIVPRRAYVVRRD